LLVSIRDSIFDLVCNACSCCARSEHDEASVLPLHSADLKGGHNRSQSDTTSSLHIIVEAGDLGSVLVEDASCVVQTKILKVDVCVRVVFPGSANEFIHELIVLLPSDSGLSQAEVEVVIQKILVLVMISNGCSSSSARHRNVRLHLCHSQVLLADSLKGECRRIVSR
jgi:hypothetical protein